MTQEEMGELLSEVLACLRELEEIRLNAWNISEANMRSLSRLRPRLRSLVLHDFSSRGRPLSQEHYRAMVGLDKLEELELAGALSMEGVCLVLPWLTRLKHLRLHSPWPRCGDTMSPELMQCLGSTIDSIDFNFGGVLSDDLAPDALLRFPRLTSIVNRNAEAHPAPLTNWRLFSRIAEQVRVLDLSYCARVSEKGVVDFLAKAQGLTELRLTSCPNVGDAMMRAAVTLTTLEVLCINGTSVSTACKRPLETGACRHSLLTLWLPMTWDPERNVRRSKKKKRVLALDVSAFTRKGFDYEFDPWWV